MVRWIDSGLAGLIRSPGRVTGRMRVARLITPAPMLLLAWASGALANPVSNGSFERMDGAVPVGWEAYDNLGAGRLAQDTGVYRTGLASIRLYGVIGMYGVASERLPFYPWQTSVTIRAWAKASLGGRFRLWIVWFNKDNLVRWKRVTVDAGTYDWKEVVLTETTPPSGAGRYQVLCTSDTGGTVWLDDVSVEIGGPPYTTVLVNQVGYRIGWPKTFVVQSTGQLAPGAFEVLSTDGTVVQSGTTSRMKAPTGWGSYYLWGDFTSFDTAGTYRIRTAGGYESPAFTISANPYSQAEDLARQFFYYQRCGAKIPGWHGYCHLDDGDLNGTHWPIIGGWHDAGDYVKTAFGEPLAFFALSRLAERRTGSATYGKILDEARWGATVIQQMIYATTGRLVQGVYSRDFFWGRPEYETDGVPGNGDDREVRLGPLGNEDNQLAAAGLAVLSSLLSNQGYLQKAESIWGVVHDQVSGNAGHLGRLIILETILRERTSKSDYLTHARQHIDQLLAMQADDGGFPRTNLTDRGVPAAGLAFWTTRNRSDAYAPKVKDSLRRYLRSVRRQSKNPFGIQQYDASNFFFPYGSVDAWKVGENSDYLSVAWATRLASLVVGETSANKRIIQNNIDWVMGKNPFGICMIEGVGSSNPQYYHHRYETIPGHGDGAVPGAIVNGIIRESIDSPAPRFDVLGNSYETNEPWLPQNCYFLLLMAEAVE
ncbi:MAG: glycoside hydrolase family 9 protein [Acidobacteriota bacterium]